MFSFGASTTQQPAQSGFGFGSSTAAPNSNFKPTLSLGVSNVAAPSTGLFGAQQSSSSFGAPAAPSGGLFGATQPATSTLGTGSLFGQQPALAAPPVGQNVTVQTKYNDLPADLQRKLDQFNKTVSDNLHAGESLDVSFTADTISQVGKEITAMVDKYVSVLNMLNRDSHLINALKVQTNKEVDNVEIGARLFESMVRHGGPGSVGIAERPFYHPQDYIYKYFSELVDSLAVKLNQYQASLDDVERMLAGIFGTGKLTSSTRSPAVLVDVIKNNYSTFMSMTSRVAYLHDEVEKECDRYLKWRRSIHNDERNPFTEIKQTINAKHVQQTSADKFKTATSLSDIAKRITAATPGPSQQQAATSIGLFGQSTAQAPTTSLFGQPSTATTGGLFGSSTATAQQPSTQPGLFGSAPATGAATGGLFGSTPATQATGGGLFGASTAAAPSSGMFGSTAPASSTGGLFGATNVPAPPPPPSGGLFGQSRQQQPPSLFGQQQQQSASNGLFNFGKK